MKFPVIADVSYGRDSFYHLMALLRNTDLDLKMIVVNYPLMDRAVHAMCHLLDHMYSDMPVAKGINCRLADLDAQGNSNVPDESAGRFVETRTVLEDGLKQMRSVIMESTIPPVITTHSYLSDVALLLKRYPECADRIARIVITENRTGDQEKYGFTCPGQWDEEARAFIFASGVPVTVVPMEVILPSEENRTYVERACNEGCSGHFIHHASIKNPEADLMAGCADLLCLQFPEGCELRQDGSIAIVGKLSYQQIMNERFGLADTEQTRLWEKQNAHRFTHGHA